jgi:hypothetical protein
MRHSPLNDDGPHWWSSIASELETSIAELPRLIRRVDEVLTAEHITDSQEFEAESILERIEIVLRDIQTTINSEENKERLRASADLLREEIAAAYETIYELLKRIATP